MTQLMFLNRMPIFGIKFGQKLAILNWYSFSNLKRMFKNRFKYKFTRLQRQEPHIIWKKIAKSFGLKLNMRCGKYQDYFSSADAISGGPAIANHFATKLHNIIN